VRKNDEKLAICPLKRMGGFKEHGCALEMGEKISE
jgi:hypothetical protein